MQKEKSKESMLRAFNTILLFVKRDEKRMNASSYEQHYYEDPKFPIIFHRDIIVQKEVFVPHWHQSIEILYFLEGNAVVMADTEEIKVEAEDVVVVPPNALHKISCTSSRTVYYCLIVGWEFCEAMGLPMDYLCFKRRITDVLLCKKIADLALEFEQKQEYYKTRILSQTLDIMVLIARKHSAESAFLLSDRQCVQLEKIKKVFRFIEQHYAEDLTLLRLAEHVGFNKYYFCHIFKEFTGMTPVEYINYIRCRKAKEYLSAKGCNVSETAALCGFDNLSYFTKIYKKINGELPSHTQNKNIR